MSYPAFPISIPGSMKPVYVAIAIQVKTGSTHL